MKVLAIETSCDETAVAIIDASSKALVAEEVNGDEVAVLSNVVSSQVELHAQYGGVVPALAAREHAANIGPVFEEALHEAKCGMNDIDLIAVTRGPGLGPALLVGLTFARTLAWQWDKSLIGINHMDGHIHSNWLNPSEKIEFPALNLIVSGGHTELVMMRGHGDYDIVGETLDDAVGECFDKVARMLGLGYPGGPKISKLAESGNPEAYDLPRPMSDSDNLNFSYSGLKTAVLYLIRDITGGNSRELSEKEKADLAASFQKAAIDVLVQKAKKAIKQYSPKSVLLSGGVSANKILRERLHQMASEEAIAFFCPEMKYTTDNAAMMAVAAYFMRDKATRDWQSVDMDANLSLGHNKNTK